MQGGSLRTMAAVVALALAAALFLPVAEAQFVPPKADFGWWPESPVAGQDILFYDISKVGSKPISRRYWLFGDGTPREMRIYNDPLIEHNYTRAGTYTVKLLITDFAGQYDQTEKSITIREPPVPHFTATIEGATVRVDAAGSTSPYGQVNWFNWTWGDGANATGPQASHTYGAPGNYTIELRIKDEKGNPARTWQIITIEPQPGVANWRTETPNPVIHQPAVFEDVTTSPFGIASREWFVDGRRVGNESTLVHVFRQPGAFNVTLRVTDTEGFQTEATRAVRVLSPPVAMFDAHPYRRQVNVSAANAVDPDGRIVSYSWDWGDGTRPGMGRSNVHSYVRAGEYLINLTVTDDDGLTSWAVRRVAISASPVTVAFDVLPANPVVGESVRFLDASFDPDAAIQAWRWEFGDGGTADVPQTAHVYREAGTYVVNLTITDGRGEAVSSSRTIVVSPEGQRAPTPPTPDPEPPTDPFGEEPPVVTTPEVPVTRTGTTPTPTSGTPTPPTGVPTERSESPGPGLALLAAALVGAVVLLRRRT